MTNYRGRAEPVQFALRSENVSSKVQRGLLKKYVLQRWKRVLKGDLKALELRPASMKRAVATRPDSSTGNVAPRNDLLYCPRQRHTRQKYHSRRVKTRSVGRRTVVDNSVVPRISKRETKVSVEVNRWRPLLFDFYSCPFSLQGSPAIAGSKGRPEAAQITL